MLNRFFKIPVLLVIIVLPGCFEPPEFSDIPKIGFNNLTFVDSTSTGRDALVLEFDFEDGDGNIGLRPNDRDRSFPYNAFNVIVDSRDSLVTYSDDQVTPPFFAVDDAGGVTFFSETDNRPLFDCNQYVVTDVDTFFIQKNEFHNNIHIVFERKRNGEYTETSFESEFGSSSCDETDLDGRIIIFDESSLGQPLTGTISYSMNSLGFPSLFRNDTIRISFYIYDRALNKSNTVFSPDFTLPDITVEAD